MPVFKPRHRSLLLGLALLFQPPAGAQVPSGGNVVGGSATIGVPNGGEQLITQTSSKAIIDWQNFSIGAGNSVVFKQPDASSVVLNRVIGNMASMIDGALRADGQVFLVNQAGVYFGVGASVDVGGLLATTLDIGNNDFMAGRYLFNRQGSSAARREVINAGVLKAREGGYIVLAGDYAANHGVIQARLGTVALAAGERMTLDIAGDSLINFAVNEKTVADLSGVENSGQLLADGGRAIMTAAVARDLATTVVNNSGLVQARATEERDGAIYLSADGGNTLVRGTLDASGKASGQKGGSIDVLGDKVALVESAKLDVSGDMGGGIVHIGGNFQGNGPLKNAQTTDIGKDVQIKADALGVGNGGDVVVWSDQQTAYRGNISAQGGAQGGDGGNVEVSGKLLDYSGKVTTLAAKGKTGNLLLDPIDINVINPGMVVTPTPAGVSQMTVGDLETALNANNVTLQTSAGSGATNGGTITIDDGGGGGVQWSAGTTLKLQADNQILIKSHVQGSSANSSIWLDAKNGATQSAGTTLAAGSLLLTDGAHGTGNWTLVGNGNNFNTFAADLTTSGTLQFRNNQGMTVGTLTDLNGNVHNGIQHANGDTQLNVLGGTLTLAKDVHSNSLYINTGGGLTQSAGQKVTGDSLFVTGGSVTLNNTGNDFNTIAANINGSFSYADTNTVTVGAGRNNGSNGITTNNHNVTITTGDASGYDATKPPDKANPASLRLTESINAGTGQISLTTGTGGVYQRHDLDTDGTPLAAGSLTARNLVLRGNDANKVTPFILNNAKNRVDNLAARANGTIAYTGGPLTVGSVDGINGITTTANTIVVPAGTDSSGRATPAVYNDDNISLSIGGNLNINQDINATSANGAGSVSIGMGGDFLAQTAAGKRINAKTLGVFGDDMKGTFRLTTNVESLAAAGGKIMVIDNSVFTGELTGIGIGAPAADVTASNGGSTVDVDSASRPVGDFYLTAGGKLNIIKLISKGKNLMLRADSLNILLDATTADGARIMLQPYHLNNRIGIHNSNDSDFNEQTNYSAETLLKFVNPTATFFIGTPQNAIVQDSNVQSAAKNTLTGDIHIGADGAFNLGYRSLSAQTSGSLVAHKIGSLYNLRLQAPTLTIHGFETYGDQIHLITNNLSLPGSAASYINPNRPNIMLRTMDDNTVWIGNGLADKPYEPHILSTTLVKLPDYSNIIISGSTDHPFPAGGPGHGDIHIPWDDSIGVSLGNRKLTVSTGHGVYRYTRTPTVTELHDGGKSGGLWQGCQNLTTCAGTNPAPIPDSDSGGGGSTGGNDGGGNTSNPADSNPDDCPGCPPADKNTDPYPPDTSTGGNDDPGAGDGGSGDTGTGDGSGGGDSGGDGGAGTGGGGAGDGGAGDGAGGAGDGDGGTGTGADGSGDGDGGAGSGGDGGGDGGAGTGGGGAGDGGAGDGAGGAGDGDAGAGTGADGAGDGDGGAGSGGDGGDDGGAGAGGGGAGDGDAGDGSGGTGDGDGGAGDGAGDGSGGDGGGDSGAGTGGGGTGDGGAGDGSGGAGDGDGGAGSGGDGDGDGGAGNGTGTDDAGDGSGGAGDGNSGDGGGDSGAGTGGGGTGDGGAGDGSGGAGDGDGSDGAGDGDTGDGGGDGGAGDGSGGAGDGNDGAGDGGKGDGDAGDGAGDGSAGDGDGGTDSGAGADGTGDDSDGTGDGSGADADGDNGAGAGSGGTGDDDAGTGGADNGNDVDENSSSDDSGTPSESGDAGSATGNGDTGEDGDAGNGSGDDTDSAADDSMASVRLDCADIAPSRQEKKGAGNQQAQRDLIEVKQDGIKMRNPCQQQPSQDEGRK